MEHMKVEVIDNKVYINGERAKDAYPIRARLNSLRSGAKSAALDGIGDFGRGVGKSVRSLLFFIAWLISKIATICVIVFGIAVVVNIVSNGFGFDIFKTSSFIRLAAACGIGIASNIIMNITA